MVPQKRDLIQPKHTVWGEMGKLKGKKYGASSFVEVPQIAHHPPRRCLQDPIDDH
jgi:hypothetical protein